MGNSSQTQQIVPAFTVCLFVLLKNYLLVFPFMLNFLPTAASHLNFIPMVKHLPFFFHLLPFFPPSTLSAPSWEQLDLVTGNVQVPDTGTGVTSVMLVAEKLAVQSLCRQQGRGGVWGGGFKGSGRAG